jgi:hypothetical protein
LFDVFDGFFDGGFEVEPEVNTLFGGGGIPARFKLCHCDFGIGG